MLHSSTGEVLWSINQITNPSLSVTAETADAVDALGVPIMSFNRAKTAEFSAENSLFDLGLMAAQSGKTVDYAGEQNKYTVPWFDEGTVKEADTIDLARTPADKALKFIYVLNGDGTLGKKFEVTDSEPTTGKCKLDGKKVTFYSSEMPVGTQFWTCYDYEASNETGSGAAQVVNTAVDFPTAGRFVMEVLGVDVCDPSTLYSAYVEFPNAKMLSDFDVSFATDSTHPFTLRAMQNYCDPEKRLFRIVVPEMAVAA